MKEITVRIPYDEIVDKTFSPGFDTYVIGKLKKAGIPVLGVLIFRGVIRGVYKYWQEFDTMDYIFKWKPE